MWSHRLCSQRVCTTGGHAFTLSTYEGNFSPALPEMPAICLPQFHSESQNGSMLYLPFSPFYTGNNYKQFLVLARKDKYVCISKGFAVF